MNEAFFTFFTSYFLNTSFLIFNILLLIYIYFFLCFKLLSYTLYFFKLYFFLKQRSFAISLYISPISRYHFGFFDTSFGIPGEATGFSTSSRGILAKRRRRPFTGRPGLLPPHACRARQRFERRIRHRVNVLGARRHSIKIPPFARSR